MELAPGLESAIVKGKNPIILRSYKMVSKFPLFVPLTNMPEFHMFMPNYY